MSMGMEEQKKVKPQPGRKPGVAAQKQRHARPVRKPPAAADAGAASMKQALAMQKDVVANQEQLKPEVRAGAVAPSQAQELFAPQEWDALLGGLDHDTHHPPAPPAHPAADDLWERLSKTRWLPKRPSEKRAEAPAVQRPSA